MADQDGLGDPPNMPSLGSRRRSDRRPPVSPAAARCPVRVLLVEDRAAVAHRLRAVLNWQPDVYVCETASNGHDALLAMRRLAPDLCLVSAAVGPATALRLTDRLKRVAGARHVLLYAEAADPMLAAAARLAGADGVVARDGDPAALARTIAGTVHGPVRPATLTARAPQRLADLTDDQDRPIVAMLVLGIHPDDVARTLGISARALRRRRRQILYELDEALIVAAAVRTLASSPASARSPAHPRYVRRYASSLLPPWPDGC
jgi:DNA-binding NarL/FixJ family response regulator